jgi:hypothetical protein
MRATALSNYDLNNVPIYVLLDVINVLNRLGGTGYIRGIRWVPWNEVYAVDIFINGEGGYTWVVDRQNFGKRMPIMRSSLAYLL